jgi:hypothetical protein
VNRGKGSIPVADYMLATQVEDERSCYSFCMVRKAWCLVFRESASDYSLASDIYVYVHLCALVCALTFSVSWRADRADIGQPR